MNAEHPEERSGIVKDAIADFVKKNPDWAGKPKDDLTVLFETFDAKIKETVKLLEPVIEMELTNSTIHSVEGRKRFALHAHKMFLDSFHTFNKEELLFLLAWTHANLLLNSHA